MNQRTVRDNYSLPRIDHMLELLIGAEWFCTLDLKSGYWQVELTDEAKPLTAFTCGPLGFYECEKMPFGASNPKTINDLRSFLGFVGYYRTFIKVFSQIAKPLTSLLEGYVNNKRANKVQTIPWGLEQQEAFNALQQACMSAPIFGYSNSEKPFILHTDASLDGLGAVLYQKDESGQVRVIAYASRSLFNSEKNYAAHRLEFLALKWAITEKFRDYLYGGTFEVFTDNNPLTYILTSARLETTTQSGLPVLPPSPFQSHIGVGNLMWMQILCQESNGQTQSMGNAL